MEFKVRKESMSVLEKTFDTYQRQGVVRGYQIASMIRVLRPDLPIDEQDLENVIFRHDPDKEGKFDLETFNKIAIYFLIKAKRLDQDDFTHKHLIISKDFPQETSA